MKTAPSIFAFLVTAAISIACLGQDRPAPAHAPRIFCLQPEYSFGTVENTSVVTNVFTIRNDGDLSLIISNVRSDCGCAVGKVAATTVKPGEQTTLEAKLTLAGRHGIVRKRILIESNDPITPVLELSFIGRAVAGLEVSPDRIYLGTVTADSSEGKTVDIVCHTNGPFKILYTDSTSPTFTATVEPVRPGWAYRLNIVSAAPLPLGRLDSTIMVFTDHPKFPRIDIPITGRAVGQVFALPDELAFNPLLDREQARLVVVRSMTDKPFKIVSVSAPARVEHKVREMHGGAFRIELRFKPDLALDGQCMVVETDAEGIGPLKIPFRSTGAAPPVESGAGTNASGAQPVPEPAEPATNVPAPTVPGG